MEQRLNLEIARKLSHIFETESLSPALCRPLDLLKGKLQGKLKGGGQKPNKQKCILIALGVVSVILLIFFLYKFMRS